MELENPLGHSGVLVDTEGYVQAFYAAHTKHSTSNKSAREFHMGISMAAITPVVDMVVESVRQAKSKIKSAEDGKEVEMKEAGEQQVTQPKKESEQGSLSYRSMYTLEVNLSYGQVAHARLLGLQDHWVRKIEAMHSSRRNVILIRKVTSGMSPFRIFSVEKDEYEINHEKTLGSGVPSFDMLKEGDMILSVNGETVVNFSDVMKHIDQKELSIVSLQIPIRFFPR
jgi:hypothetical protein